MENLNKNFSENKNENLNENSSVLKTKNNTNKVEKLNFVINYKFNDKANKEFLTLNKFIYKIKKQISEKENLLKNLEEKILITKNKEEKNKLITQKNKIESKVAILNKQIENKEPEIEKSNKFLKEQELFFKNEPFIKVSKLNKSFNDNHVLNDLDFEIKKGERIAVVGANGAGKSTFSGIIAGIKKADSGTIDYNFVSSKENFGDKVAIQFQHLNYPEGYKVKEIVNFFYKMVPKENTFSKKEFKKLIKDFGIDNFYHKSLISLSGGQQQRINLFLTLIKKPSFLILDELSAGLDVQIYEKVKEIFRSYIIENNVTLIIVSHNLSEIKYFTDKVYLLKNGKLSDEGDSKQITDEHFFNLIKREYGVDRTFQFDFSVEKIYKPFFIIRYYEFIWNYFVNKHNSYEDLKRKVDFLNSKNKEFLKKLKALQAKIDEVQEKIKVTENKKEKKALKKEFIKLIKSSSKYQNKIDLTTMRSDKYLILVSDDYLLKKYESRKKKLTSRLKKLENDLYILKGIKSQREELYIRQIDQKENFNYLQKEINKIKLSIEKNENKNEKLIKIIASNDKELENINNRILKRKSLKLTEYEKKLEIINLKKYYDLKPALNGINLEIKEGERVAITGPNGSGKTTLSEIVATTLDKTLGSVKYWFGRSKNRVKHEIGMQFQESLFPYDLTVQEILTLFLKASMWSISEKELNQLIKIFRVEHLLNKKGDVLSGGERQKINVLIALLKKPSLLILDEISTGLDVESILDINEYITKYLDDTNATLILISHNYAEIKRLTDKLVILKNGEILETHLIKDKSEADLKKIFDKVYGDIIKEENEEDKPFWKNIKFGKEPKKDKEEEKKDK